MENKKPCIKELLNKYGFKDLQEANKFCLDNNINVESIVKGVQSIAFDNAVEAYILGTAIALKKGKRNVDVICESIGDGLQAYCTPGSVAERREIGIGHGRLASMLLLEETKCFCFLAGHESFAAAEGARSIAQVANQVRKNPLKVVLNGMGKDAAYIVARINGFTYVNTKYDQDTGKLNILNEVRFSEKESGDVKVYGAEDVNEGVAIMKHEKVDVSITGNSTNAVRFQHLVAGTYKKWCVENNKKYFSVASGGGTGRTLHPDNLGAGPASYGFSDSMGRMHSDAQFAGSSSVPAHVAMMGFIGMGNNPIVGTSVAIAVAVLNKLA